MEPSIPEVLIENLALAKTMIRRIIYPEINVISCKYVNNNSSAWWSCKLEATGTFPSPADASNCPIAKSKLMRNFSGKGRIGEVCQLGELRSGNLKYYWRVTFLPPTRPQKTLHNFIKSKSFINSKFQEPQQMDEKSRNNLCGWIRHSLGKFSKRVSKSTICFIPAEEDHGETSVSNQASEMKTSSTPQEEQKIIHMTQVSNKFQKITMKTDPELSSIANRKMIAPDTPTIIKTMKNQSYSKAVETLTAVKPKVNANRSTNKVTASQILTVTEIEKEKKNKTLSRSVTQLKRTAIPPPTTYQSVTELYRLHNDLETLAALNRLGDCDGDTDYATSCELLWVFTHLSKRGLLSIHPRQLHELREYALTHTSIPKRLIRAFRIERPIGMTVSKACTTDLHLLCKHSLYVGGCFQESRLGKFKI